MNLQKLPENLSEQARSLGWDEALYDYCKSLIQKNQTQKNQTLPQDVRSTDWLNCIPLNKQQKALIVGGDLGSLSLEMADQCSEVHVIDNCNQTLEFLQVRKEQQEIPNLYLHQASENGDLPFEANSFDIISINMDANQFKLKALISFLSKGGMIHILSGNRHSLNRLLRPGRYSELRGLKGMKGYRKVLKHCGLNSIEFYAPLPDHIGTPLFYLPLGSNYIIRYFLKNIFPLFEMVSPEVKRQYAVPYYLARIGVRLSLLLRVSFLMKYFVPSYMILAKK